MANVKLVIENYMVNFNIMGKYSFYIVVREISEYLLKPNPFYHNCFFNVEITWNMTGISLIGGLEHTF